MRNYSKFFTPRQVANFMVSLLQPSGGETILDPHAGRGDLLDAVRIECKEALLYAVELDPQWESFLKHLCDVPPYFMDFLSFSSQTKFDKCIANPPFGNGVNLDAHINHMMYLTRRGGRIVTIVPADYQLSNMNDITIEVYPIENWAVNSDGTITGIKIISFLNP